MPRACLRASSFLLSTSTYDDNVAPTLDGLNSHFSSLPRYEYEASVSMPLLFFMYSNALIKKGLVDLNYIF